MKSVMANAFLCLLMLASAPTHAATQFFTYSWSASGIADSNNNPPPNGLLTTSGSFTVAFDPEANPTLEDVAIVSATSFTDNEGVTLTSSDIFSTVSVHTISPERVYQIVVGAITYPLDKADQMVGDTNDFRLRFRVYGGTGSNLGQPMTPTPIFPYFVANGSFAALTGDLTVSLTAVSPTAIPLPASLPLFLGALGFVRIFSTRNKIV